MWCSEQAFLSKNTFPCVYFHQSFKPVFISPPVHGELTFRQLTESQSLELSCSPQQEHGGLTGLHLYHRSVQSQTTLLSMAEDGELRVDPEHRGRLQLCGGLDSLQVNVTVTHLQPSDTGLYIWELTYRDHPQIILSTEEVFLLVEGTGTWLTHLTIQCLHSAAVKSKFRSECVLVYLYCREVMPVLPQVPSTALHRLCSSRASSAHPQLPGCREMCEYLDVAD